MGIVLEDEATGRPNHRRMARWGVEDSGDPAKPIRMTWGPMAGNPPARRQRRRGRPGVRSNPDGGSGLSDPKARRRAPPRAVFGQGSESANERGSASV